MRNHVTAVLLFICIFSSVGATEISGVQCSALYGGPLKTKAGVALGVYKDALFLAFMSADRQRHIHVYNLGRKLEAAGNKCSAGRRLPSRTSATPALAEYKGKLWMAFKSADSSGYIYYQSYDGKAWSTTKRTRFKTGAGPALAVFDNRLHMVWREGSGKQFYAASFDGKNWSVSEKLRASHSTKAPALAVYFKRKGLTPSDLYAIYMGAQKDVAANIRYAIRDRDGWNYPGLFPSNTRLANTSTALAPALAAHPAPKRLSSGALKGKLYLAAVTRGGDCGMVILRSFGYYIREGSWKWKSEPDPAIETCRRPALVSFGEYLVLGGVGGRNEVYNDTITIYYWKPEDVG